jgi:hypothetical protein
LLFLQPFFLMSAGLMGYTASLPGRRRRVREFLARPMQAPCEIPTWGTLRQEMGGVAIQGGSLRLRLLAAVALGYGLPCFAGIFVLGIFFGGLGDPDPRVVGVVFAIAAGASVLAGLFALVATPTGKARLHIDTVLGRLSLTSRRRSVELSLSQVASWIVRPVPIALSHESGSELAFAPLLAVVTAGGEETPIHVFPADEEGARIARKAAEGFAEMTGKPVHVSAAPPAGAAGASGSILSEVMDWIRKASSAGKEYSDLT